MQLKTLNKKKMINLLREEDDFISKIFAQISIPSAVDIDEDNLDNVTGNNDKIGKLDINQKERASNHKELYEKLYRLKGIKLNYNEKLSKKGLKTCLKKKEVRNQNKMSKKKAKLVKSEMNTDNNNQHKKVDAKVEEADSVKIGRNKPIFNSEGHVVFSKFDFSEVGTKKNPPKVIKSKKKLLENIKNNKKHVNELKNAGEIEKAKKMMEKHQWKNAISKATGEKVKDDPELLKKSIKRDENKKMKSSKKWEVRKITDEKNKKMRQAKRQKNILNKNKENKLKKIKKAVRKGRIIPGF